MTGGARLERQAAEKKVSAARRKEKLNITPRQAESFRRVLTDKQYAYFSRYTAGMRVSDIAAEFGVCQSVVSHGIARARKRLEAALIIMGELVAGDSQ